MRPSGRRSTAGSARFADDRVNSRAGDPHEEFGRVTVCAIIAIIGSALWLVGAAGMAFMTVGPFSKQLFDPANLPPAPISG